jgi:hypothetical protein
MTHRTCLLSIVTLALCGTAAARQQVIINGSFELLDPNAVLLSWSTFGGAVQDPAFSLDGDYSLFATVRENAYVGAYQDTVSVGQNVRILMKAYGYVPSSAPLTPDIIAGIKLEFDPPEGLEVPPPEENLAFDANQPLDTWVPISLVTEVPPNVDTAKIVLISFENPEDPNFPLTNGPLYADVAFAERSSAPGVNQLLNESFEQGNSQPNGLINWTEFAEPLSGTRRNSFEVPPVQGVAVAKFTGRTTGLFQVITVAPGETLTISCNFRSRSTAPYNNPLAVAGVKVEWASGSIPEPDIDVVPNGNPVSGTTNIINNQDPTNTWLPVTIDYTIPPQKAAKLRATAITAFGPADSDVYFDAFEMVLANVFDGSDVNNDDAQDMIDIATLQQVYTGPGAPLEYLGLVYDHNENSQLEMTDVNYILPRMTGPAVP